MGTTRCVLARAAGLALVAAAVPGCGAGDDGNAVGSPLVASISVAPASAALAPGSTVQLAAIWTDASGKTDTGRVATWQSVDPTVAQVNTAGMVTAIRSGATTIVATIDGIRGQAAVSVEPTLGARVTPSTGDPMPQPGDRVLFDFRSSLQQVTNEVSALNLVSPERNGRWHFTTNYDGAGTHALRVDWPNAGGCVDDGALMILRYPSTAGLPRRVYVQWKQRMGRTSTGGGIGALDAFAVTNPACGNASRKEALMLRDVPDGGGTDRVEYIWPGPAPAYPTLTQDATNYRMDLNQGVTWEGQQHVAQVITQTIYYQAESSLGAHDGMLRLWINGQLLMEDRHAAIGAEAFERWEFPTTMRAPAQDQSEYFWDMVSWVPAQ